MARRYHEIKGLAEFTAKTIVSSEEDWKKFLHTAGHMFELISGHRRTHAAVRAGLSAVPAVIK